jgi:hypothetical protein
MMLPGRRRVIPGSRAPWHRRRRLSCWENTLHFFVTAGKTIYRGWMFFVRILGIVNRFVVMTIFYWVIIDVANLCLRLLRVDLLDRRMRPRPTYWQPKPPASGSYTNQF